MITFSNFLLKLEAGEVPPQTPPPGGPEGGGMPPSPGGAGGDPLSALGGGAPPGGDPMGGAGGAPQQPRKAINVTTWEDALKTILGKDAHRPPEPSDHSKTQRKHDDDQKKPKSLMQ
jgi:hypothetical protein